jgi:hypothetical protein
MMLLPVMLSACAASDDGKSITYTDDRGVSSQPFPKNYRAEVLAFFKTYLNNPVGVRDAVMAEPVERVVGSARESPTAVTASRANAPSCSSMAASIASSKTLSSPVRGWHTRRSWNWRK